MPCRIEERGAMEDTHRTMQNGRQIFRYAVATGRAERDSTSELQGTPWLVKGEHFTIPTDLMEND